MPNIAPPPAQSAAKPKRRIWRWILIVAAALVALAIIGFLTLAAIAFKSGGSALNRGVSLVQTTKSSGMMGLAAPMAPSYDLAQEADESYSYRAEMMYPVPEPRAGQTAAEVDQKIIKNGSLQMVVMDVGEAATRIAAAAAGKGGFVQSSSITERADGTHYGQISVRVPAKEFEASMAEIKGYAETVKNESASGQDVTEQYTDLEAQLRNARAQEQTFLAVLDKAKNVEDILKVQEQLGRVRGIIESLEGRLKYLENVTTLSTISVYLEEEPRVQVPTKEFRPWSEIKAAVQSLVAAFQQMLTTLIWLVIVGGGLFLPIAILVWIIVVIVKRMRRK